MDGLRTPVGDEPPAVYWRRRLVVVVAAVALVLLLWFLISATLAGGDEDPDPEPATTNSPQASTVGADDPSRLCTADDLTLAVAVSPENPTVGSTPAFDLAVEHTGASVCMLSTDTDGTDLSIRSGEWIYYSTTYCPDDPVFPAGEWVLKPGDKEALQATWSGQRVDEDCGVIEDAAGAGTYWASTAVGGVPAPEVQFQLTNG